MNYSKIASNLAIGYLLVFIGALMSVDESARKAVCSASILYGVLSLLLSCVFIWAQAERKLEQLENDLEQMNEKLVSEAEKRKSDENQEKES